MTEDANESLDDLAARVLDAALIHVPFDGWSEATLRMAAADTNADLGLVRAVYPRGAVDLALAYHERGDKEMVRTLHATDLSTLRFRDKIATAVRFRLDAAEKEAVRRGSTLFALPQHSADGARAIWSTADAIWTALGDQSEDVNWYTKRATLSAVYGSTVLYWLGDTSEGHTATWAFLDRRIGDVMQFEKLKAQVNDNPVLKRLFSGPNWVLSQIKAPGKSPQVDLPGHWSMPSPTPQSASGTPKVS